MKHPKVNAGSIFVRLQTVNGNTVRILPTMITFFLRNSCGGTQVFIEGRNEPLVVKQPPVVVARLIRRAYRALILLGLLRHLPFPFFGGLPFGGSWAGQGYGVSASAESVEWCDDDDDACEEDDDDAAAGAAAAQSQDQKI